MKKLLLVVLVFGTLGVSEAGVVKFAAKSAYKGAKPVAKVVSYPARHPKKSVKALGHAAY